MLIVPAFLSGIYSTLIMKYLHLSDQNSAISDKVKKLDVSTKEDMETLKHFEIEWFKIQLKSLAVNGIVTIPIFLWARGFPTEGILNNTFFGVRYWIFAYIFITMFGAMLTQQILDNYKEDR